MKFYLFIVLLLFTVFRASHSSAQVSSFSCINPPALKNKLLQESFDQPWNQLKAEFMVQKVKFGPSINNSIDQNSCGPNYFKNFEKINLLKAYESSKPSGVVNQDMGKPSIKKECVSASLQRFPGNKSYACIDGKLIPAGYVSGGNPPCVTQEMSDYMAFSVNRAINCMSDISKVDPKSILNKFNTETGFNPSLSSVNGKGLGQLTTPAINEMTWPESKGGRGRFVLEAIKNSSNPECNSFKSVAENDLKQEAVKLRESCDWLGFGDGLTRNLIYSIGYYVTLREKYIIPMLKRRGANHLASNEKVINELSSIAYGREGLNRVKVLLGLHRVNSKTPEDDFDVTIRNSSKYLDEYAKKMKELLCIKEGLNPNDKKECDKFNASGQQSLAGDACIE
jgi:hypothetical protein